ncbi:methyltransferase domain-containing protein [Colletotrichum sublineola]|uniref:Putative methyltransferase domain-containing protein n=1 Tax=Colletotrichum sublineola TaxID=1173701 RepID=A0A066XTZ4_COLSU|nr:methyltransferase domain-containing protein [Colletotrichum sublineola]KDN72347.1 putative methyltransferase domain-containing protein [Colletotrichum sublineola]
MATDITKGRTFASEDGPYQLPNDAVEHERLDAQYRAFAEVMGGKVFHAPFAPPSGSFPSQPRKILDIGCGTGIFTAQLARLFPSAEVIGVDLSPVPAGRHGDVPNARFLLGSVADLLGRGELEAGTFDYVFQRLTILGIVGWEAHLRDVVAPLLAPGGFVEVQEYDSMPRAGDRGCAGEAHGTELGDRWEWFCAWIEDTRDIGLDLKVGGRMAELLAGAGIGVVARDVYDIPNAGPPSLRGSEDGYWNTVVDTYWGVVERTSGPRRSPEALGAMRKNYDETFAANIENLIVRLHVVIGRKPATA